MTIKDQMGRALSLDATPQKIVSLVPSLTELLIDLGLQDKLVGRTKFCIHPRGKIDRIPIIGGTKKIHHNHIDVAKPDLIIGAKEENNKNDIELLTERYPVYMSNIHTVEGARQAIEQIAEMTGSQATAQRVLEEWDDFWDNLPKQELGSVLYMIWHNPCMAVGSNTFIHDVLGKLGFSNILQETERYPVLQSEEIEQLHPDYVFLSSEPFPFKQKHLEEIQGLLPQAKIRMVDGEAFSWYGTRLLKKKMYLQSYGLEMA